MDNASIEVTNSWLKEELFTDFHVTGKESIEREIEEYACTDNLKGFDSAINAVFPNKDNRPNLSTYFKYPQEKRYVRNALNVCRF